MSLPNWQTRIVERIEPHKVLLGLIPYDDGTLPIPAPTPYRGSVRVTCQGCDRPAWIGPALSARRDQLAAQGTEAFLACLICVAVYSLAEGADIEVDSLTDKRTGE